MLPESLRYFAESLVGLSRNTIQIQSQSGTTMATNGNRIIRFSFPNSSIVDLASFAISADCEATGLVEGTKNVGGLIPSGGLRAMIDRCSFSCGGISLSNDVSPLGVISRIKDNLSVSIAKSLSDKRILDNEYLIPYTGDPAAGVSQTRKCVATNLLGFCEAAPRYFDCSLAPQIYVQLALAGNEHVPVQFDKGDTTWEALGAATKIAENTVFASGTGAGRCEFIARNVQASIDVLSIATGNYSQMLADLMAERGSLIVPFPSYNTYAATGSVGTTVRGSLSTSCLNKIYAVARLADAVGTGKKYEGLAVPTNLPYTTQQAPVTFAADTVGKSNLQASHCFTGIGIKSWRMRVNNAPYPLYSVGPLESYARAVNAEDRSTDSQAGSSVTSLADWYTTQFACVTRFSLDNDRRRLSGLDCSSINAALSLVCTGDGSAEAALARDFLMVAESTSRLMIGPGRAVSVVY